MTSLSVFAYIALISVGCVARHVVRGRTNRHHGLETRSRSGLGMDGWRWERMCMHFLPTIRIYSDSVCTVSELSRTYAPTVISISEPRAIINRVSFHTNVAHPASLSFHPLVIWPRHDASPHAHTEPPPPAIFFRSSTTFKRRKRPKFVCAWKRAHLRIKSTTECVA